MQIQNEAWLNLLRLIFIITIVLIAAPVVYAKERLILAISGIEGDALSNVQARLDVEQASYQGELTPRDIENFYRDAPENIKKALEPYGYFNPEITSKLTENHSVWAAQFKIKPGPALHINSVQISVTGPGKNNLEIQTFIKNFPIKKNQVLLIDHYEKTKEAFFEVVNNQGYLKAKLDKKEIRIDTQQHTADIILEMNTGPQYYFGSINYSQSGYAPSFLKRFNTIQEGQPFSSLKLLQFQQNLNSSRYFKNVSVTPEFDQTNDNKVPTNVDITLPKSQQYNIGAGYGTFTGPRLTLGMDLRHIGDSGQHFAAQMKLSSVLSGLSAKYYIPGDNPLTDQYTLGLNIQRFLPKNGESFSEALSAAYVKQKGLWRHTLSLNALNDLYKQNEERLRNSHLLYPSYNISRISADDIINPKFGNSLNFTIQGSSSNLLSTTSFFQAELKGKYIISPTQASRLIFRGDLGYTVVNDLNQLPLTLNFFAGGINSVRGYPFDSIGPGRYLRVGSVELQHKIAGDLSGAAFYDFGNASDHFDDSLNRGDGLGLIYTSAIGPIKLYVGRAESKKGKPMAVELSIGPEL